MDGLHISVMSIINTKAIQSTADQAMMTPPPSNDNDNNNDNAGAVIIFDWDDTILPSSYVDRSQCDNLSELPSHTRALFREIEICTEKCLSAAACHGEVSTS